MNLEGPGKKTETETFKNNDYALTTARSETSFGSSFGTRLGTFFEALCLKNDADTA